MHPRGLSAACAALLVIASVTVSLGQRGVPFRGSRDHPAIAYSTGPAHNGITALNQQLREGLVTLEATGSSGYLGSVLTALDISLTSQVAVFSPTSFQARLINSKNPRVIYFNDSVAVAWVRGGDMLEVAAQDRQQGVLFYTLDQNDANTPQFQRNDSCLACHLSWDTLAVPGLRVVMFPIIGAPWSIGGVVGMSLDKWDRSPIWAMSRSPMSMNQHRLRVRMCLSWILWPIGLMLPGTFLLIVMS